MVPLNQRYVKWPYLTEFPPWEKYPSSQLFQSTCFANRLNKLYEITFNTSPNVSLGIIAKTMNENNCTLYLHGGVIRDIIQGVDAHDIDGEYSCKPEELLEILNKILNPDLIWAVLTNNYFHIGSRSNLEIELFNWRISFFDLEEQEFTPNTLYFDTSNYMMIDLSGKGVEDAINKYIRIPVERDDWDLWLFKYSSSNDPYLIQRFLRKIPRFWKLKASGYSSPDNSTMNYLKNVMETLWNDEIFQIKNMFFGYLCFMTASEYNNQTIKCENHFYTNKTKEFCEKLMVILKNDLSDIAQPVRNDTKTFFEEFDCFIKRMSLQSLGIFIIIWS